MINEIKRERLAILAYLYQLGFDYHTEEYREELLRKFKELPEGEEAIEKRTRALKEIKEIKEIKKEFKEIQKKLIKHKKLIIEEAKKKNLSIYELVNHYLDYPEELFELLKKKIPKFKKTYIHKEMENILHGIFVGEKLKNKGMQIVDIPTIGEESITGEVMIWENKGIEYFVKADDILKLEGKNPKAFASQIKNISLLMGLTQEQQYNNSTKEAKCEFTFPYYAERRGYSKEDIKHGGNFFNELKRDLLTGAYTTYRIDKIIIEGKEYIAHGIPNFYILYEPKDYENKWKVDFNNPYNSWIIKILKGEAKQYFITNPKAIEDRITTEKPYLFLFYMQLVKRKRDNLLTVPKKIGSLLEDMKLPEKILIRPKECFKILKECLIYFSEHYEPVPELEGFRIYNDFNKTETIKLPLSISEAFKQYPYEDFKDLIKSIGIKDIREAFISFKRPYKKTKRKLNKEENELLARVLNWFDGQVTKIPYRDQESLIKEYILKLGYDDFKELFETEANKYNASAVDFLTRVLPGKKKAKIEIDNKSHISEISNGVLKDF